MPDDESTSDLVSELVDANKTYGPPPHVMTEAEFAEAEPPSVAPDAVNETEQTAADLEPVSYDAQADLALPSTETTEDLTALYGGLLAPSHEGDAGYDKDRDIAG